MQRPPDLAAIAVQDLAYDLQLAWVDRARNHELGETFSGPAGGHACSSANVRRKRINGRDDVITNGAPVAVGVNIETHVEPGIAIEDVVAEVAADGVVASTAEDDLITGKGCIGEHHIVRVTGVGRITDNRAQSVDAIDAGLGQVTVEVLAQDQFRGAGENVVVFPARQAFDRVEPVTQDECRTGVKRANAQIAIRAVGIAQMDGPIEAVHPVVALDAWSLDHDVVAGFTVIVGVVTLTVHNVVANDWRVEEQFRVVAADVIEAFATFDPVVAFVAANHIGSRACKDKVVAFTSEEFSRVGGVRQEVLAGIAEQQVDTVAGTDDVITLVAAQEVVTERIFDDVVAFAAEHLVGLHAGVEIVVAAVAPKSVDAFVAKKPVITLGSAEHDVRSARIL